MKKIAATFFLFLFLLACRFVFADEFTSSNFRVADPVIVPVGYGTSSGYQLWGTVSQIAVGTSSAASFRLNGGFLYFPFVTTPVVGATPGNGQVLLSWSGATGYLGWSVGGYSIGRSSAAGGPYTYSSVGNVTSSTRTGLTNGTTYYFVVRPEDAFGNAIATSSEVSATPVAPPPSPEPSPTPTPSSGGGAGAYVPLPTTGVNLSGRAYPLSRVTLLKDGQIAVTTIAGPDAKFETSLAGLSAGSYLFAVYSEDPQGRRSVLFTFPIMLTQGAMTTIGGIFLAPTIAVDKSEVKRGDTVAIFGQSVPNSDITISVNSDEEFFNKITADQNGAYLYNFDTSVLEAGQHLTKSKAAVSGEISSFSQAIRFAVGTKNITAIVEKAKLKGDVNNDGRVNLVDFSIAAYWYKRPLSPAFAALEKEKLSGDGKVDLVDFSIMAYYWTG